MLSGKEDMPLTDLPTPAQVQCILMLEIGGQNRYQIAPSHGTSGLDAYATKQLLETIVNPGFSEREAVVHAACPTLDYFQTNMTAWQNDGLPGQTDFQFTITPASAFFDVHLHDNYRFITLLSDAQVTFAYPPSPPNTAALQARYKELARENTGPIWHTVNLEHGIAVVQKPGETLMLPPFWSSIIFCTKTCVSAAYSIATVSKFTQRFTHADLFVAQLRLWPSKTAEQTELVILASSFATHLDLSLNTRLTRFDSKPALVDIRKRWDKERKAKFGEILAMIEDEAERAKI
jgi:hypothetical protein